MNELIPYLKDVASMECQLYTQDRLLSQLYQKASALGNPKKYTEPKSVPQYHFFDFFEVFDLVILFGTPLGPTLIVFIFDYLASVGGGNYGFRHTFLCYGIFFVAVAVFRTLAFFGDYEDYCSLKKKYEKDLLQYNTAVKKDERRVKNELVLREKIVEQWQQVKLEWDKTKKALDAIYEVGVIHPKYHNLVAVTSFLDYFDTGRCLTLTGPGGAYATYEEDLRFKRIETRLDVVISKLDEIVANQQYMAELMREANDTLSRIEESNNSMMKDVKKIKDNSELTAYNTQCSAQSDNVMEHIMLYQTIQWS